MSIETVVARVALHGHEFDAMTEGLDRKTRLGMTYWYWPREALPRGFNRVAIARRERDDQDPSIWLDVQVNLCSAFYGPEWAFAGLHPDEALGAFERVALKCSDISGECITPQQLQLRRLDYNVTRAADQTGVERVCMLAGVAFGRARKGSDGHFTFRSKTTTEVLRSRGVSFEVYDKGLQPDRGVQRAMRIPSYRVEVRHRINKLGRVYTDRNGLRWRPTGVFLPDDHALANRAVLEVEQMLMMAALDETAPLEEYLLLGGASLGTATRLARYAENPERARALARTESERQGVRRWRRELEGYMAEATRRIEEDPTVAPSAMKSLGGSPLYVRDLIGS